MKLSIIAATFTATWVCLAMHHIPITQPPKRLYMQEKYQTTPEQLTQNDDPSCFTSVLKRLCKRLSLLESKYTDNCMPREKIKAE